MFVGASAFGKFVWGDGNRFSGNRAADLGSAWDEEVAPAGYPPAQAAPVAAPLSPTDALLLRELECVVCSDIMLRPFSACHLGHASACMSCYEQLDDCPVCRGDLLSPPTRLLPLEAVAQNLMVPCPHAAVGCPLGALLYADAGAHAAQCDWRKVTGCERFYAAPSRPCFGGLPPLCSNASGREQCSLSWSERLYHRAYSRP